MRHLRIALLAAALAGVATVPAVAALTRPDTAPEDNVSIAAVAIGNGISYQGRLVDGGAPANGIYDLRFIAFDSEVGGTQFGNVVTREDVPVTNGTFTVQLDFGDGVFAGDQRWVELAVKPGASGSFTVLSPRQPVAAVPYALHAKSGGISLPYANGAASTSVVGLLAITQTDSGVAIAARRSYLAGVDAPALLGTNAGTGAGVQGESTAASGIGVQGGASGATGIGGRFTGQTGVLAVGTGSLPTALEVQGGSIKVSGATRPAFVHEVAIGNTTGIFSVIDNPQTNGDANAIVIVTHAYNPGGGAGIALTGGVGVRYLGVEVPEQFRNKWAIVNSDNLTALPSGAAFNVLVIKQ